MRSFKTIGVGLLAGVLALSIVACGEKKEETTTDNVGSKVEEKKELTIEERIVEASKKIESLENYESKINMELAFEIAFGDEKSEIPMNAESDIVVFKNPFKSKLVAKVETPFTGEPEETESYMVEENGKYIEYQKNEGKWEIVKDSKEQKSLEIIRDMDVIPSILKEGTNIKEIGTEDISGKQTTKVQIELNSDILKDTYKNDEMFEELYKSDGTSLTGEVWLSKDNDVVQFKFDMASVLKGDSEEGKVTKAILTIVVDKHNKATEFEIPEEALKAEE